MDFSVPVQAVSGVSVWKMPCCRAARARLRSQAAGGGQTNVQEKCFTVTVRAVNPAEELAQLCAKAGGTCVVQCQAQVWGFAGPFWPTASVSSATLLVPLPLSLQGGPVSHQQLHLL